MNKEGVLVVGSANMDLVVFTQNFPKPGETVFGNSFNMFPGGKGANQAVSCARLGAKTYFIAKLGKDDFGNALISSMNKDNIDLSCLIKDDNCVTGTALISVDSRGENEIIVISGANMELSSTEIDQFKELFFKVKVVLTQLEIPLKTVNEISKIAENSESIFILNPAPAGEVSDELLRRVDILTPNETELETLTGKKINSRSDIEEGAKILLKKGVKNIIVTLGDKGALLVNNEHVELFPSLKVNAVDSTAAGDTFNGALAFALANEMTLQDAIQFSTKAAAISVTKKGAQISMPSYEELLSTEGQINKIQEEL